MCVLVFIIYDFNAALKTPVRDARDISYIDAANLINTSNLPAGSLATVEVGTIGYLVDRPIVDMVGLTSTNPELITGNNNNLFFEKRPQLVVLHDPVWPFERAIYEDIRFQLNYELIAGTIKQPMIMQIYSLKDQEPLSADKVEAYIRSNYKELKTLNVEDINQDPDILCALDYVNGQLARKEKMRANSLLSIRGWLGDKTPETIETPVVALITKDKSFYRELSTYERSDVAAAHPELKGQTTGVELKAHGLSIQSGDYQLKLGYLTGNQLKLCPLNPYVQLKKSLN